METNYYEIKILRLKILYILAGWAVFIGIELFSAFFLNTLLKNLCTHSHLMPNTKDMIMCAIYLAIIIFTLSFILDILLFSNQIRLRLGQLGSCYSFHDRSIFSPCDSRSLSC